MRYPITTGQAATLLFTTEPRLADLVRKGKIVPPPEVVAGRRLWQQQHLLQAAEHLGVLTTDLQAKLVGREVAAEVADRE
jgi:hypothetical protein